MFPLAKLYNTTLLSKQFYYLCLFMHWCIHDSVYHTSLSTKYKWVTYFDIDQDFPISLTAPCCSSTHIKQLFIHVHTALLTSQNKLTFWARCHQITIHQFNFQLTDNHFFFFFSSFFSPDDPSVDTSICLRLCTITQTPSPSISQFIRIKQPWLFWGQSGHGRSFG